ncbi:TonB-dependent receptor [Celeribacter sp.]|uniref:TonB-dependent receptor n=1 Tax=Celeribacter sp. TaxID=1890673 RepID=UPI003A959EBF
MRKIHISTRGFLLASALIAPSFWGSSAAFAQDSAQSPILLDEIIVYGALADRSLQDTASSVSVVGEEELEDEAASETVSEVIKALPNIYIPSTTSAPVIRGVDSDGPLVGGNAYLAKPLPRTTMSLDGQYVTAVELGAGGASTWDVDSIEVYRGPQTTSQGANAIAGAIVVNTKDPTFTPEYALQALYGSRGKKRLSFAASGPLSDDLAARIAVDYSGRDTFVDYTNANFTEPGFDYDFENLTARAKLLWEPAAISGLSVKLTYNHNDMHRPNNEAVTDADALENTAEYQDYMDVVSDGIVLDVDYDFFNGIKLSNQMQYSEADYDFIFAYPYSGEATRDYETFANELKLTFGEAGDVWSGVIGLFYSNEDAHAEFANSYYGAPFGSADLDYTTESTALYGEVTWQFATDWALTGGLRLQQDKIEIAGTTSYVTDPLDYSDTFTELLPSLTLAHDVTPDWTLGATISKGYLPGGSGTNFRGGEYYEFDPEESINTELFVRGNALDGALLLTGNLFYTEYKNIQRSVANCLDADCTVSQGSMIVNGEKAHAYGIELSADYQANSVLTLSGNIGAMRTEVTEFTDYDGNKYEGNEFANAPGYTIGLAAAWDITPDWTLQGDARIVDGYSSSDTNDADTNVDGYALANMRIGYHPQDNVEYFAYVNNVFDNRAALSASSSGTISIAEPREVGFGVSLNF